MRPLHSEISYRPEVDGLRALAVIAVILFHTGLETFSGGFVGVDVFFVISGYLITSILLAQMQAGKFHLSNFYERRIRRILPALFLVMLVSTIAAFCILQPPDLIDFGRSLIAVPLFIANFHFWNTGGYFGTELDLTPLLHTWSLSVEEQFYVFYPLFLMIVFTIARQWVMIALIACGIILSLWSSNYLTNLHFETAFYLPFTRIWELLLGAVAAFAPRADARWPNWLGSITSLLGLGLVLYAILAFDSTTRFPGLAAVVPTFGTFLLLISRDRHSFIFRLLTLKFIVYVGLLSYSLYLWHQPIFVYFRHLGLPDYSIIFGLILTFVFSVLTFHFVERPFRRLSFLTPTRLFQIAAATSGLFIIIGIVIISSRGLLFLYDESDAIIYEQYIGVRQYVDSRFDQAQLQPFANDGRKRIFLVGDSYARDLLNIIHEGGIIDDFSISTKQINRECGNVYVEEDFTEHIPPERLALCRVFGWYDDPQVRHLASEADEIWLASSWQDWSIDYLSATITNLEADFGAMVRVFGIKNFGYINARDALREALALPLSARMTFTQPAEAWRRAVNMRMRKIVPTQNFVELLDLFCGGSALACKIFTDRGQLISWDGVHLTREGATYLAPELSSVLRRAEQ
jgi:peptidoglycan/LPS O-acetylase OafA/YrhL